MTTQRFLRILGVNDRTIWSFDVKCVNELKNAREVTSKTSM